MLSPILSFISGCTPEGTNFAYTDTWSATNEICAWDEWDDYQHVVGEWQHRDFTPAYPSQDCADAVYADFGVEPAEWEVYEELYRDCDLYGLVAGDGTRPPGGLHSLLWNARALLTLDMGELSELHLSGLVDLSFLGVMGDIAAETESTEVAQALYNLASTVTQHSVPEEGREYWGFSAEDGTLVMPVDVSPYNWEISALVHEARHAWGYPHIDCRDPRLGRTCDQGLDGPAGFELVMWKQLIEHEQELEDGSLEDYLHLEMLQILQLQDDAGRLHEIWDEEVDLATH